MWRDSLPKQSASAINKTATCDKCPKGLVKYIELAEFPPNPIKFYIDRSANPANSSGVVQAHYWIIQPSRYPNTNNRFWIADINPGGGSFLFQPVPAQRFISLFKKNGNKNNQFYAICFYYIPETRTFVPQTFT